MEELYELLKLEGFAKDDSLKWEKPFLRINGFYKYFDTWEEAYKRGNELIRRLYEAGFIDFRYRIQDTSGELYQYNY